MNNLLNRIMNADGVQWFGFVTLLFFAAICWMILAAITADHKVRCYYLHSQHTNAGIAYRIMSDVDWMEDRMAYTTADGNEALEVISGLKQCAR